jgi:hypothetical protein
MSAAQTADVDGDGIISMEDFRGMIDSALTANARKPGDALQLPASASSGTLGFSTKSPGGVSFATSTKSTR